jgi:hypothetical protein
MEGMRRTLVLLLILAGIVAAVLLLLTDGDGPRSSSGEDPAATEGPQNPARGDPLGATGGGTGTGPDRQPGIERSGADPEAPPPLATDSEMMEVEVVRRADRTPVPNAEVIVVDLSEENAEQLMEEFFLGLSVESVFERFGTRHRTGPDGRVRLPIPGDDGLFAGSKENLFGLQTWYGAESLTGPERRLTIEVDADAALQVRVSDENGRPVAGVQVALRMGDGDSFSFDLLRARTGEDGIGRIPHAAAFATVFGPDAGANFSAAIAAVLPTAVATPVDIKLLPEEPVELRLPATGSVRVKVLQADGNPCAEPLLVALAKARDNPEDDDDWLAPGMPGFDAASQRSADGEVRFDHVGLGLPIQISAVFPGAPQASIVRAQGPQRAGETVDLVLTEQLDYPILIARLVDSAGQALAGQTVQAQLIMADDERDWSNQHEVQTGADGTVRVGLTPVSEEEVSVAIEWVRQAEGNLTELYARQDLARPFHVGENDLGAVTLGPSPLLASGRVLDPEGKPVPGANVMPQHRRMDELEPGVIHLEPEFEKRRETDKQGNFSLNGVWTEPDLALTVRAQGFLPAEVVIVPGAQDVEVRLSRSFELKARLLADPGVDLSELGINLQYQDKGEEEIRTWPRMNDKDGTLSFRDAPPGRADLVLTITGMGTDIEVLRIGDIAVGSGVPDPRLDPIDLRGKLYGCRISARGADGSELEDLQAWPVANPAAVSHGWEGAVSLISQAPLGEVAVAAQGWRELRLTPVKPTEEVVLTAGLQIRITTQTIAGNYRLGLLLISENDPGSWWRGTRQMFDAGGRASAILSSPGRYQVAFLIAPSLAEGEEDEPWGQVWVQQPEGEARQVIEVIESNTVQSFRVNPPPAERIAEALKQLEAELEEEEFNPFQ